MELRLIKMWFGKMLDALRYGKSSGRPSEIDRDEDRLRQTFTVRSDGLAIHGAVLFPVAHPARQYPVVILCHGIPGSGAERPANDPGYEGLAQEFTGLGVAAVIFNFRGCGESEGDFNMAGWPRDLEAVLDTVANTPHIDPTRLILVGFSGGGAAAIKTSAESSRVFALASVSAPSDFGIFDKEPQEIVDDCRKRGLIRDPDFPSDIGRWVEGFREIEPRKWIGQFKGKHCLIMHGDEDELIPVEQAHELFRHAPAGITEIEILKGGVHRLRLDPRCVAILKRWVVKVLGWSS